MRRYVDAEHFVPRLFWFCARSGYLHRGWAEGELASAFADHLFRIFPTPVVKFCAVPLLLEREI
jgi:hypothetical protein